MIKALFLDFYGTVVHEDGEVIKKITQIIYETGKVENKSDIGTFWWLDFEKMFTDAFGDRFETQRALEEKSLEHTLAKFASTADAKELSNFMFEHWLKPPIFDDAKTFFDTCQLPIYLVSNIDTADILQAVEYHSLKPAGVFTSEDAKAYKPRKELFELALKSTGLKADEVIHIGDSISSDVKGASSADIKALWLNRFGKEVPDGIKYISNLSDIFSIVK